MNKKYIHENFSIENILPKQVERLVKRKVIKSNFWKWVISEHEIKYIYSYIEILLLSDKSKFFINGTKIYDLFNIYYMDFTIDNYLLIICQKKKGV